jgi:AraC family transcriptional regulator, transcriptional activator of pobA
MIEVDLDYIIPIVNKVANSENLLYLRENPCLSLSEEQYTFVENLLKSVEKRINRIFSSSVDFVWATCTKHRQ